MLIVLIKKLGNDYLNKHNKSPMLFLNKTKKSMKQCSSMKESEIKDKKIMRKLARNLKEKEREERKTKMINMPQKSL